MPRNLILLSFFLFLSCQNGSLTPGVGESDTYISLMEELNSVLSTNEETFSGIQETNSFASFEISKIISINQLDENWAYISVPEFDVDSFFEWTEIIKTLGIIRNYQGQVEYDVEITFILATNHNYYSESEFPLTELYYFTDYPEGYDEGITVNYFKDDFRMSAFIQGNFNEFNKPKLSFEYQNALFHASNWSPFQYIGSGYGLGNITAEKVGEFPDF